MQNKLRFPYMAFLFLILLALACQNSAPSGAAIMPTATPLPGDPTITPETPAPTSAPQGTQVKLAPGAPPTLSLTPGKLPEKPGVYLLYGSQPGQIQFISVDGKTGGTLLTGIDQNPNLQIKWMEAQTPGFILFDPQIASIWKTDLTGQPLEKARAWTFAGGGESCVGPALSPHGNWALLDCLNQGNRSLVVIDLQTEALQRFDPECTSAFDSAGTSLASLIWSEAERDFLYECGPGEYRFITLTDEIKIRKYSHPGKGQFDTQHYLELKGEHRFADGILGISPNWEHIVLAMGEMPPKADGTSPGLRIFVAALACVLKEPECEQKPLCGRGTLHDLAFKEPYDPAKNPERPTFNLAWSHSGQNLFWTAGTSMGRMELSTHETHFFADPTPGFLLGLSPDDQWLAFYGFDPSAQKTGLFLISAENPETTHFLAEPENGEDLIRFYGWLKIP